MYPREVNKIRQWGKEGAINNLCNNQLFFKFVHVYLLGTQLQAVESIISNGTSQQGNVLSCIWEGSKVGYFRGWLIRWFSHIIKNAISLLSAIFCIGFIPRVRARWLQKLQESHLYISIYRRNVFYSSSSLRSEVSFSRKLLEDFCVSLARNTIISELIPSKGIGFGLRQPRFILRAGYGVSFLWGTWLRMREVETLKIARTWVAG